MYISIAMTRLSVTDHRRPLCEIPRKFPSPCDIVEEPSLFSTCFNPPVHSPGRPQDVFTLGQKWPPLLPTSSHTASNRPDLSPHAGVGEGGGQKEAPQFYERPGPSRAVSSHSGSSLSPRAAPLILPRLSERRKERHVFSRQPPPFPTRFFTYMYT